MQSRTTGGVLLIAGTCIGAGALALPLVTATSGFLPSLLLFIVCWGFMTASALLLLEVCLATKKNSDLITMAHETIGTWGQVLAWTTYLALLYSLTALYITGGGPWINGLLHEFKTYNLSIANGAIIFTSILALIVIWGTRYADSLNRILMFGLVIVYLLIVGSSIPHVNLQYLTTINFAPLTLTIPIIVTTFGYHVVIPALTEYIGGDRKELIKTIFIGSLIPLVLYVIWEIVVLGIVPLAGENGLHELINNKASPNQLAHSLQKFVGHAKLLPISTKIFSLFALMTSFLGVSISLFHFLRDGLAGLSFNSKPVIGCITFLPPLLVAILYPDAFIFILGFAGIFIAVLLGVLPALMAWYGRYKTGIINSPIIPGGKPILLLIIFGFLAVIPIEIYNVIAGY